MAFLDHLMNTMWFTAVAGVMAVASGVTIVTLIRPIQFGGLALYFLWWAALHPNLPPLARIAILFSGVIILSADIGGKLYRTKQFREKRKKIEE